MSVNIDTREFKEGTPTDELMGHTLQGTAQVMTLKVYIVEWQKMEEREAVNQMPLERFLVNEAKIHIKYTRTMTVYNDQKKELDVGKSIEENALTNNALVEVHLNQEQGSFKTHLQPKITNTQWQ